jgi:hypothetical protein
MAVRGSNYSVFHFDESGNFTVFLRTQRRYRRQGRTSLGNESCLLDISTYLFNATHILGNSFMKLFQVLATASLLAALMIQTTQAAPISGQGTWQTTLQNRDLNGDGVADAFYDTQLNITWLRNANVVGNRTIGLYGVPTGPMTWDVANNWAANLNVYGVTGWRLPTTNDTGAPGCGGVAYSGTDCGWNVQTSTGNAVNSELAHLYYVTLGNKAYYDVDGNNQAGSGLTNTANFQNFEQFAYWSGTVYAPDSNNAWYFMTGNYYFDAGGQYYFYKYIELYAVAVRSGDVGAAAVPVPPSVALMLLALGAMTVARRKRPA